MKNKVANKNKGSAVPVASRGGQLIVEMMVAISLLVIGLLGIFAVLSQSLGLNRVAANQYIAANLAAEGIEVTKNILDINFIAGESVPWNSGFLNRDYTVEHNSPFLDPDPNKLSETLKFDESSGLYGYDSGKNTNFRRVISIKNLPPPPASPTEIKVTSHVYWKDRGGVDFEIELEDRFRNWRE